MSVREALPVRRELVVAPCVEPVPRDRGWRRPAAIAAVLAGRTRGRGVDFDLDAPPEQALAAGLPNLADTVRGAADPLALLGECTLAPAVTAGLRRRHPDLALVWVDAHGDLNTPETTPSGFLGGMPFAILLGSVPRRAADGRGARPGASRGAGRPGRRPRPRPRRARRDRPARGWWSPTTSRRPSPACRTTRRSTCHLDGDVLDPEDAPGVDFPAPDGWRLPHLVRRDGGARRDRPRGRREPLLRQPPPRPGGPLGRRVLPARSSRSWARRSTGFATCRVTGPLCAIPGTSISRARSPPRLP